MKQIMFSVFDQAAAAYLPPFFCPNVAVATRAFQQALQSESHQFARTPGDYTLFELGEFNQDDGSVKMLQTGKKIGNGLELRLNETQGEFENGAEVGNETSVQPGAEG